MNPRYQFLTLCFAFLASTQMAAGDDWANWRGPEQNGISRETGLISDWSLENKKHVLWESEIGGRATPIIMNDRVYLNCRTDNDFNDPVDKVNCREQVVCWDAKSGKVLWKDVFNVFQTDIPAPRVGWAAMCGDPETDQVYVHSVDGIFRCYSAEGDVVWEHSLLEEFGKISGYGGRTQTPIVDEDRVIVSFLAANWGDTKGPSPKHYYYAFDKNTGDLLWTAAPGGAPKDTNYSVPIVRVINGTRMLIGGNADGNIYGMNARTGEMIWKFRMSKRGLNSTPATDGKFVYISHGEDNIDNTEFGRVQCIDASGKGDITETHGVWHVDGLKAGYTALLVKDGILYVVADTGNLFAFDAKTGDKLWDYSLGTVGKGSPVWADGKLYVMEVNGNIHILKPSREKCVELSRNQLKATRVDGLDEIYASPAISNGRIVFVTRDRTICVGADGAKDGQIVPLPEEAPAGTEVASLQLRPFEVVLDPNQTVEYKLVAFDSNGRVIKTIAPKLSDPQGLSGLKIDGNRVTAPATGADMAGTLIAKMDGKTATARIRYFNPAKQWKWDFEGFKGVQVPPQWLRAHIKVKPIMMEDGNTVLQAAGIGKGKGRPSHTVYMGRPDMADYTIQADVFLTEQRRQLPNIGLVANRYNMIIKGNVGRLVIQSWAPHLRMAETVKFRADPDVWYTMKLKVDSSGSEAKVYGKVWKRSEPEPQDWTIQAIDPHPNKSGNPGLYVYAITDCMFDNVVVDFDDKK
ncbi:MAG: PQQ-binding-like beta-propeller repeat protein [Mariniblastus sp.]|nr:PQQ-binding-like beta-propeller repeat protein [Mariniblastus sp.]